MNIFLVDIEQTLFIFQQSNNMTSSLHTPSHTYLWLIGLSDVVNGYININRDLRSRWKITEEIPWLDIYKEVKVTRTIRNGEYHRPPRDLPIPSSTWPLFSLKRRTKTTRGENSQGVVYTEVIVDRDVTSTKEDEGRERHTCWRGRGSRASHVVDRHGSPVVEEGRRDSVEVSPHGDRSVQDHLMNGIKGQPFEVPYKGPHREGHLRRGPGSQCQLGENVNYWEL